ncbi:hypothetical protein MNAN1_003968 [Malassezia nana]|uniref:Uncharacterized protein n=1 Tax=Malassezia nana TaxID=180528 RepID=A0AAF0EV06_9BASI|nr:hypothetical protein MNAN1_003968 [Malassezia nana]
MEAVTTQWDAWRAAPVSARAAQAYVDLAVAFGKTLASSEEARYALCPEAMWSHVADVLNAWMALESEADTHQRDERACTHIQDVKRWMQTLLVFERMSDPALLVLTRVLAQCLVNVVTSAPDTRSTLWTTHVTAEGTEPWADALLRLLASADERTSLAAHVFLLNCLPPGDDKLPDLVYNRPARRVMEVVLQLYEAAVYEETSDTLPVTLALVDRLFVAGLAGPLLDALGPAPDLHATQLALLRALIECLHQHVQGSDAHDAPWIVNVRPLIDRAVTLSQYATDAMQQVAEAGADAQGLVRAYMGLLALFECLHWAGLRAHQDASAARATEAAALLPLLRAPAVLGACIQLLRQARAFYPPQAPFTPSTASVPEGHAASALHTPEPDDGRPGLPRLKRSALQLLGTLSFLAGPQDREAVRDVQDHVRELGGLVDVLSLTALDELNPCTCKIALMLSKISASMLFLRCATCSSRMLHRRRWSVT